MDLSCDTKDSNSYGDDGTSTVYVYEEQITLHNPHLDYKPS